MSLFFKRFFEIFFQTLKDLFVTFDGIPHERTGRGVVGVHARIAMRDGAVFSLFDLLV